MEKVSNPDLNQWYVNLLNLDYYELVNYLRNKYGKVSNNYYTDYTCEIRTRGIGRTREGLSIHHIDEDKVPGLSNPQFAINSPWEYQLADRLVYCDLLEHLILHIKIYQYTKNYHVNNKLGIYGAKKIMEEIDAFYCGEVSSINQGKINLLNAIVYLREEYLFIVNYARKIGIMYEPRTLRIPYVPPKPAWRSVPKPSNPISSEQTNSSHTNWFLIFIILFIIIGIIILNVL